MYNHKSKWISVALRHPDPEEMCWAEKVTFYKDQ